MKYFILIIFELIFSYSTCFAYEIQCRYMTDYQSNQEALTNYDYDDPSMNANQKQSKGDILLSLIQIGETLSASIDNDIFYCTYTGKSNDARLDALEFLEKLKDKKIVPLFFYDGWVSKFYEVFDYNDINTPFSQKRENGAQQFEFVFRKRSIKSTIKFFGFKEKNSFSFWAVDKKNASIRPINQAEWEEITQKYLKK